MKDDTLAFLVAGRSLDASLLTHAALARVREVCAAVPDLAVIVAGDTTEYDGPPAASDPLYSRVVIGFVAARAQSEYEDEVTADPLPIDRAAVDAALARVRALDDVLWARVAAAIPRPQFSAARMRAGLTPEQRESAYAGVAFDGPDLRATSDRVHLVASGPLAGAVLARGEVRPLPTRSYDDEDDEGDEDDDRTAWVYHGGNNERPRLAVFGTTVARVHIEDRDAIALAPAQLEGDLFLLAVYD